MKTAYLCLLLVLNPLFGQEQPGLQITIIDGEGALNNIKGRIAREPIVQVQDEHHNLVPGVLVTFTLPQQGAGAVFANGAHTLTVTTDAFGRAAAYGMQPNSLTGSFQIHVTASYKGQTAHAVISQTNVAGVAAAGNVAGAVTAAKVGGLSVKAIVAIIAVGAGAAAGGAYFATHNGNSKPAAITISAGPGTVSAAQ